MTILMHTLTRDGKRPEYRPVKESEMLLSKYRDGGARDLLVLHNKSPQWNEGKRFAAVCNAAWWLTSQDRNPIFCA